MSTSDAILSLKAELRAAMNGIASKTIRESGMGYRLVFGVELPRLRQIAHDFIVESEPTHAERRHLAIALWQEDIRECRMLAIMLYPIEDFDREMAALWVERITPEQAELAQLMAMDLLCHEPYAPDLAFCWIADEREMFQLCGFLTLTRLLMNGAELSPQAEAEFLDQAAAALKAPYQHLRKAVQNALLRFGEQSDKAAQIIHHILCT